MKNNAGIKRKALSWMIVVTRNMSKIEAYPFKALEASVILFAEEWREMQATVFEDNIKKGHVGIRTTI